jgi:short-subunit dehydrogenase
MTLKGKDCVLTGATGGIGESFAQVLASAGARLILVARSQDKLDSLLSGLPGEGHRTVAADLSLAEGRGAVCAACAGGLDILINAAGVNHFGLLADQSEQQLQQMMDINVTAPMLLTRLLLPALTERKGVIVNVGSSFGSIGFAGYCGYSTSKFALRGFTEALRRELSDTPVSVLYLSPRATATAMNSPEVTALNEELGNATDRPERVAQELMVQLQKHQRARFIGWPERFFVKLNALFPAVVDSALSKQLPVIRRHALAVSREAR